MKNLAALLLICFCSPAFAWDGPPQAPGTSLGSMAHPSSYLDGNILGLFGPTPYSDARARFNWVLLDSAKDTVQLNAQAQRFRLPEDLPLAGTAEMVPRDLGALSFGATYNHRLDSGDDWGLLVSGGSASDQLFNSFNEDTISGTATYRYEKDRLHSWIFLLNYATNRPFAPGIPLPGVSYLVIDPANHTVVSYGVPFFISWSPTSIWTFQAVYFIPTLIQVEADAQFFPPAKFHFGFDWLPQSWLPANRADTKDRLILDQKKLSVGIKSGVWENLFCDLSAGFAFDQKIFLAESLYSSGIAKTPFSSAAFIQGEIALRF